jgi:hypothetical protein
MKIVVNSPMMSDKIINLLCEYKENGVEFKFIKKTGIKIEFEVSGIEVQEACSLAKSLIKNTEFGNVLYFNVAEL